MSHVDPDVLALRALGEQAGTAADDAHVPGCQQCQAELRKLSEVVALAGPEQAGAQLTAPPADVWSRIVRELGPEAGTGLELVQPERPSGLPAAPPAAGRGARLPWWRRPVLIGAACLLIGVGAAAGIRQLAATPAPAVVASITLRPLPQFPQWQGVAGTAVMERDSAGRLLRVSLRAPARPGFYEVWLLARDGVSMISLGDLNSQHTGVFTMPPGVNLADYSRIDVSLQPFNGSTLHSRDSVVRGSIPG